MPIGRNTVNRTLRMTRKAAGLGVPVGTYAVDFVADRALSRRLLHLYEVGAKQGAIGWYARSAHQLRPLAEALGAEYNHFAAVLAITSPRVHVSRNLSLTVEFFRRVSQGVDPVAAIPSSCMQSTKRALVRWLSTGVIRGPKTGAFYRALTGETGPDALVLDVWMARALEVPEDAVNRKYIAEPARALFVKLADIFGVSVPDAQAAVWVGAYLEHFEGGQPPMSFMPPDQQVRPGR